jgi:gluconolactonase
MGKFSVSAAILFAVTLGACPASAQAQGDKPAIVRLDPALDALVSPDAKLQLVKGGFGFTEGIIWVEQGRYLLLSDIPANVIYKLTPKGGASIYMHRSGYTKPDIWRVGFEQTNGKDPGDPLFEKFYMIGSNGLALDRQGRLIIATWAGRSIDRIERNGKRTVLADRFEGRQFNGPNDVIVKRNGTIYFTDTYGGLRLREKDPRKGLDFQGVYMIKGGSSTTSRTRTGLRSRRTKKFSTRTAAATSTCGATASCPTTPSPTAGCSSTSAAIGLPESPTA